MRYLSFLLFLLSFGLLGQGQYKHNFKTVPNDPYQVLHYQLDNGLEIYLSVNKDEPRVSTNIAVRTGSKNDPPEVTGLAHYLEHMLFKGNSKIASLNWSMEKPLLDGISAQYEIYRKTTDEQQRKTIYAKIDSLSGEAAKYVATNEYDQMMSELGARGTNAYTSLERTVYVNDIPTIEMEKWMMVESVRFRELTLRLFHTELEAVYEEFNRGQDNDGRQVYYERMKALFPNHTYGTQTTLGTGEDLKNPSMVKIHEYFDKYYVPNNMAIIMVGDLDPDKTVDMIQQYFGSWKKGPQPDQYKDPGQPAITEPITREVVGSETASISLAYRVNGIRSQDAMMVDLVSSILSNGEVGLIDKHLNNNQKVLRAYAYSSSLQDYSLLTMGGTPRKGQSLEQLRDLLLQQVEELKNGEFDESLISAIVKNAKKSQMSQAERNSWKAYTIIDAFVFQKPWEYYAHYYDQMETITKKQVIDWANENLINNYVVIYKREGERQAFRIEKPQITAVTINRGVSSEFRKNWEKVPSARATPVFVNYQTDISHSELFSNLDMYYIPNKTNELFSLNYIFDMGSRNDQQLALAVKYLPYLGTDTYSVDEIKEKFYDLGLDYSVYAGSDRLYVTLSGLNESLEAGTRLFEDLLAHVKADKESYTKFVDGIVKERQDAKLNKYAIMYGAMMQYATYGPESPQTDALKEKELRSIDPSFLAEKLHTLKNYRHKVFYYGPSKEVAVMELLRKVHPVKLEWKEYPPRKEYPYASQDSDIVYFVNYDQVQTELMMLARGQNFNKSELAPADVFNQYFGAGLSSIVFQEIRESKALAYSAYSVYTSPSRNDEAHFVRAYIGTQSDKLQDAVAAMQELMTNMPRENDQFEQARLSAMKQIETNPITKASMYWSYQQTLDRGLSENPRPEVYSYIKNMSMDDMQDFFNRNIKGRHYAYLVIGKKDKMDMTALKKLGTLKELSLQEIFGY